MYATKQDMIDRFGEEQLIELTDRAEPLTGEINDAVLNAALVDASATIDSYIARRYKLPLGVVPAVLTSRCMTLAWYALHRGRHTEETRADYMDATDYLRQLSNGTAVLDVAGSEPPSAHAQARAISSGRTFSRKKDGGNWY